MKLDKNGREMIVAFSFIFAGTALFFVFIMFIDHTISWTMVKTFIVGSIFLGIGRYFMTVSVDD